jgi:uncharacterized protein
MGRLLIGLVSDTHGLFRPEAVAALSGCRHILHAGDVGLESVLEGLREIAPVTAVRGNVDCGGWAAALPALELVEFGGVTICLLHDLTQLDLDPVSAGIRVVVCGHSHQPRVEQRRGVLVVNPGSAGPRRFTLPVSVGRLLLEDGVVTPELVELTVGSR